jgi:hypothetical protein
MADQKSNWLWWTLGGVALLGVGVGTYMYFRSRTNSMNNDVKATEPPKPPVTGGGTSNQGTGQIVNPFKNENEVIAFQKWVNDVKNGNLVVDGKYGPKTNAEYQKYFQEYITAVTVQNTPNLAEGFAKIKTQMLDKNVWGDNTSVDVDTSAKLRFSINIKNSFTDAFANFIPSGYFWLEIGNGGQKSDGTWTYSKGIYTVKMNDNSFQGSDNEISEMIKQIMKLKYPSAMSSYSFSGESKSIDDMMNMAGKQYVDSNDAML